MDDFEDRLKESLSHAYDIERELGGGGMSRVFVATDRILGRKIVIKLLSPELTAGVNRARFRREIQVAAQLQHPHIVTLLSAGEDGDIVYYTMPFIEGESLKSVVERGPLPVRDVIRVLYDVVDALSYAHQHGVVHRDIKPGNILRSGNHALVTDFGVAKALNAAMPSQAMTSTGMAIGTPAYMAPEQLAGDPAADHRVDIYAVGLLAYELLVGESPFARMSPQAVMAALFTLDPKPVVEIRKDVPKRLSAIVMQCLAKAPDQRPPNAEALIDAFDAIATTSGEIRTREHKVPTGPVAKAAKAPAKTKKTPVATPVAAAAIASSYHEEPDEPKRGSRTFVIAGAALVVLVAIAAFIMSKNGGSKTPDTIQPPPTAAAEPAPGAAGTNVAAAAAAPVMTKIDSMAIAAAVEKRLAAAAAAAKKPGQAAVNTDSLRQALQKQVSDSVEKAKAAAIAAAPPVAPAGVAPGMIPASHAPLSGTPRLAIAEPKENADLPNVTSFSHALSAALRGAIDKPFVLVDQDSVREVVAHTSNRDEAVRSLQPDVLVAQTYQGTGDTVTVSVSVRDLRTGSTYGVRNVSSKVLAAYPQYYVKTIAAAVAKQLEELLKAPSIYGR